MNPLAAVAVKTVGAAGAAALLSLGIAGGLVQAASPNPSPSSTTTAPATNHPDRGAIARAVFESEADVLGLAPKTLRQDLLRADATPGRKPAKIRRFARSFRAFVTQCPTCQSARRF